MSHTSIKKRTQGVSPYVFYLYMYFLIDLFLRLSARIPPYGAIRPTLLLVIIISVMLLFQKRRLPVIGREPIVHAITWLIIYILVTLPLVKWPGSVLFENIPDFVKSVVFLFFTALIIDTDKRLRIFLIVFCTCQIVRIFEPLYLNITEGYWGSRTHLGHGDFAQRLSGAPADIVNPNGLGFIIATVIPYLHYLLWRSRRSIFKLLYITMMPIIIYTLILTMSRGAFIALMVVVWMIFKDSKRKLSMILVVSAVAMYGWANLSDVHKDRYLSLISIDAKQSTTVVGRIEGMLSEFGLVLDRPLFGHGLGTSLEAKVHAGLGMQISHNLYAEVLIETGIIGFALFFVFLKSIYWKYRNNRFRINNLSDDDGFALRLNAALGTVFWMYVVYSINYFGLSYYYWYMFGGVMIAFSRIYKISDESPDHARISAKRRTDPDAA